MNDSPDKHAPTEEFVEYLARDTMRRLRQEARFAPSARESRLRSRIPTALAIAAGVVLTLSTGMVLGASANYASAEVLPNGTTMIPSRPALAILPIKNALTAIGCTQTSEKHTVAPVAIATPTTKTPVADVQKSEATTDQLATPPVLAKPDRALIATYAKQHQAAVVRGDTVSDYIVMVLDATNNYVWSTHGNGNVMIEVGGDARSTAERAEYNRAHAAEFGFSALPHDFFVKFSASDSGRGTRFFFKVDSPVVDRTQLRYQGAVDTAFYVRLRSKVDSTSGNAGRGGGSSQRDSLARPMWFRVAPHDSVTRYNIDFYSSALPETGTGCMRVATRRSGRVGRNAVDSTPSIYTNGWQDPRHGVRCNQASGLRERSGAGESGIVGLASSNVSAADLYSFAAGELAPRGLRVMVVYLTAGTAWSGR